jgi:hypothetical protein
MLYRGITPADADAKRVLTGSSDCHAGKFFERALTNQQARYVNLTVCGCTNAAQCMPMSDQSCSGAAAQEFEVCLFLFWFFEKNKS